MEFKRDPRSFNRNRLNVPGRQPTRFNSAPPQPAQPPRPTGQLFEPDEPLIDEAELDEISFRDILGAWGKKAVKHSPLENKLKTGKHQVVKKSERLREMKNDLKWALMADLDEPVKPRPKPLIPPKPHLQPQPRRAVLHHPTAADVMPKQPVVAQPVAAGSKSIDINISFGSLPKIPWEKLKAPFILAINFIRARSKKQLLIAVGIIAVVVIAAVVFQIQQNVAKYNPDGSLKVASQGSNEKPSYKMMLPSGKTTTDIGNVKRVSPPNSSPAFAFADNFRGTKISVTEQPIPDSFKPDIAGNVATLAKNYAANNKITINGVLLYIGTSHDGPQSIIFTKHDLLVLIKSASTRNENDWAWYADNLQ